jgi:hypothetical protein
MAGWVTETSVWTLLFLLLVSSWEEAEMNLSLPSLQVGTQGGFNISFNSYCHNSLYYPFIAELNILIAFQYI